MVSGDDAVVTLPHPIGAVTYNEWHALTLGGLVAVTPALALVGMAGSVRVPLAVLAYLAVWDVAVVGMRFSERPVLREAWYFLAVFKLGVLVVLVAVVVAVAAGGGVGVESGVMP